MIILSEITDKLQVVLAGAVAANQLQCFASWRDRTSSTFVAGRTAVNTNSANDVDLVGSPVSSTQRVVDFFTIYNRDTANATVTIKLDANGTEYILFKATLATGETLMFQEGSGFCVLANSGAIKYSVNQGNNSISTSLTAVVLGADVTNNNAIANTIASVTGLEFPVIAGGVFYFWFIINYTAAVATTGSRWSITGPTLTRLSYTSEYTLTATTSTRNAMVQAYDSPAACNASSIVAQNHAVIGGIIVPSANGSVTARFASEIANSAIVAKAGSVCYYQRLI